MLDLIGDLGGVIEVLAISFGILLVPMSKHLFILRATKKLFLAKTDDDSLFLKKVSKHNHEHHHHNDCSVRQEIFKTH